MKKFSTLLILGATISGIFVSTEAVKADETKNTQASIIVKAGDLKIKSADSIQFSDVTINGSEQNIVEKSGTKSKMVVEDFRGSSSKGWTLKAKLKEGNFNGIGLKLAPSINSNKDVATAAGETQNLNTTESLVASVSDVKVVNTEFDTEIQLNAKMSIPANIKANTYATTIVWNLAATPETK